MLKEKIRKKEQGCRIIIRERDMLKEKKTEIINYFRNSKMEREKIENAYC